jgi:hypothetical protein
VPLEYTIRYGNCDEYESNSEDTKRNDDREELGENSGNL